MSDPRPEALGAKDRDYFWTVLAVDPVALPLVRLLRRNRWLSPDQVTWLSFLTGIATGPAFAFGGRAGLVAGALLYYTSFLFDCVDGKLARATGTTSPQGARLEEVADGARRASASLGLVGYLWNGEGWQVWLAIGFALAIFYFMQISGGERKPAAEGSAWTRAVARRRLLPNPGMPDVAALAFVLGPLTGLVVPGLLAGAVLVAAGILRVWWGAVRR